MIFHTHIHRSLILLALVLGLVGVPTAAAQEGTLPQDLIRQVSFDQNLDAQVPPDLTFTDSTGQVVRMGDYFGDKPVILLLNYYECPMLCGLTRQALLSTLDKVNFTVGDEFKVVIVSIDPSETPAIAEAKRRDAIANYDRPTVSTAGWHFLVGQESNIKQLADSVGFNYAYDARIDEYVHPSGFVILTPDGHISRYLFGINFPARDVRLGLVEAAAGNIGSPIDQILLTCYHYDPISGEYTLAVHLLVNIAGGITVVIMGIAIFIMARNNRDKHKLPQTT